MIAGGLTEETSDKPLTIRWGALGPSRIRDHHSDYLVDLDAVQHILVRVTTAADPGRPGPSFASHCEAVKTFQLVKISPAQAPRLSLSCSCGFRLTFFACQVHGCLNVIPSLPLSYCPDRPENLPEPFFSLSSSSISPSHCPFQSTTWPTGRMLPSMANGTLSSVVPHQTDPWLVAANPPFIGTAPSAPCYT